MTSTNQSSQRKCVRVELGSRSYDVLIGAGLINETLELATAVFGKAKYAIVTDENVASNHLASVEEPLKQAGQWRTSVVLPAGEKTKSFEHFQRLSEAFLTAGTERRDVIIALGGGVIGDLGGFAAAVQRRGVRFLQIPTSLLAQVDSSVGGKTGINTPQGKNLIGAFHQPNLVLADTGALATLPERQMRAGYGEIVKYGLLGDRNFYSWLEDNAASVVSGGPAALIHAVTRSVEMKAEIVARDETETGDRALLNLGHTFGHALEAWTGYSDRLLHGEGVAIGICLAFRLSEALEACPPQTAARVAAHIKSIGLPTDIGDIPGGELPSADLLVDLMGQDKKVQDGQLTFILARDIGEAFITRDVSAERVRGFLQSQLVTA
ncbi:MAG: 3-dehydroquinate synthase [Alphaproteobacteria bacterium]|jgi:3-dehydroquinate synthase